MTDTDAGRLPVSRESRTTGPISSAAIRTPAARPLSAATFAWSLVRHNPRWASVRGRVHLATLVAWAGFVAITAPVAMLVLQTGDPFGPDVLIGCRIG